MESNKEKDEILSRRHFFKSAAKAVLPVVGLAVFASLPQVLKAEVTPNGCEQNTCKGTCTLGCKGYCGGCDGGCVDQCTGCYNSCRGECQGSCRHTCAGWER